MKKNMGNLDRVARIILALVVVGLYMTDVINGTVAIVLLVFSAVFFLTSMVSICPLYSIVGISTCKTKPAK
ncbi:MAG: DUF2892 domain-containing protein [Cyclobacteriaceae bacterium]|nr:DUF2892 domain-containing protein [Cyclobacteriaceae bacterium]